MDEGTRKAGASVRSPAARRRRRDRHRARAAPAELSPAMEAYFEKCDEKLGFVPNVLKAYAFDMAKLEPSSPCTTT